MAFGSPIPDKTVLRSVTQALTTKSAGSGARITAVVSSGTVTLSGMLAQETQRRMILSAMGVISGVKRVIDTMKVTPPKKREF